MNKLQKRKKIKMNKKEKLIVFILVVALIWSFYNSYQSNKKAREEYQQYLKDHPEYAEQLAAQQAGNTVQSAATNEVEEAAPTAINAPAEVLAPEKTLLPKETLLVKGDNGVAYSFTSKGGAIESIVLNNYKKQKDSDDPVVLDFSEKPAMLVEMGDGYKVEYDDYQLEQVESNKVVATAVNSSGVKIIKTFTLPTSGYVVNTTIRFENSTDAAIAKPDYYVSLGAMKLIGGNATAMTDIALDCRSSKPGKDDFDVNVCGIGDMAEMFGGSGGGCSAAKVSTFAPLWAETTSEMDVDWVTVRDRFFVQFVAPLSEDGVGARMFATRQQTPNGEFIPDSAAASILFKAAAVPANGVVEQNFTYYVGPRKMSELRSLGKDTIDIMSFGTWEFFCVWLLDFLNFIARIIPLGYGVAIILLTIIVRLVLYPINRKSAAGMRKMQEIQPLIKEINEKYKDDPQQRQQETMRVYGEHKINPLSSCLPMLIQLPIFVALFTILRSSVELRFESFLWIPDLSSPENLFRDTLGFGVNILPILMAVTMGLQTSLTPSAGDPAQRKMMTVMMPVMMLVMFYSLPSALTLYWTVSQILAIIGMLWYNKRHPVAKSNDGVEVIPPPRETRQMRRKNKSH